MSKELKVKEETKLAVAPQNEGWGAGENVDAQDLSTPVILIGQSTSEAVKNGEVKYGQIYDSLTKNIIADKNQTLDIIVFKYRKKWFITKGPQFVRIENFTAENANEPYEWTVNGETFQRSQVIEFIALNAKEVQENGQLAFPYAINFMKGSRSAGKTIATICSKLRAIGKSSASCTFTISAIEESNDKGQKYYVFNAKQGRQTTAEEQAIAKYWYDQSSTLKVVEEHEAPVIAKDTTTVQTPSNKKNIDEDLVF